MSRLKVNGSERSEGRGKMKDIYRNFDRIAILAVVAITLLACASTAAAENSATLSKKELKTLLATAKTPADQQKLAAYYRDQAQRLTAKAQDFSAQADVLARQPAPIQSKQGISCNCTSHYRYFSKLYAQEAKDSETLAAQHQRPGIRTWLQIAPPLARSCDLQAIQTQGIVLELVYFQVASSVGISDG